MMSRSLRAILLALAIGGSPGLASAQRSPLVDHLIQARTALNELRFAEADSLASFALRIFGAVINRDQRTEALAIAASARFPEIIEGAVQYPDSALLALRDLVRLDPDMKLRSDLSWSGLDSLMDVARATTFAPRVRPRDEATFGDGSSGLVAEGTSTRPARWRLELRPAVGGAALWTDTLSPRLSAALAIRLTITAGRPSLASGDYALRVVALDGESTDSVAWTFFASVTAPTLELVPMPAPVDSTLLLPEITAPARGRGIFMGIVVAALTAVGTGALRGVSPLGDAAEADGRAIAVGGLLAVGSIVAGFLDNGSPILGNKLANTRVGLEYTAAVQAARVENQRRLNEYRVTIVIMESK